MNIVEAPNMLQYSDPTQWIRDKILPVQIRCTKCDSTIILDHESDLYASSDNTLGFNCIVCDTARFIIRPDKKKQEEYKKLFELSKLSDEEYAEARTKAVVERAKIREQYLSYKAEGTKRKAEFQRWNSTEHRRFYDDHNKPFPTYEEYIEEKYLPAVPPEEKPKPLMRLMARYDEVLEYYKKQAKESAKRVELATPDTAQMPTGAGLMACYVIVGLVTIFVLAKLVSVFI